MGEDFEKLSRDLMDELLSWDPVYSTQLGWHKYDWRFRDPRILESERQAKRCAELVSKFENIRIDGLSADQAIDRDLAIYLLRKKMFEINDLKLHEKEPTECSEIGYALFFLSSRNHPDFDKRMTAIIHRLEAVPEYLERSRAPLRTPYRTWCEASLETGNQIPDLMKHIEILAERDCGDRSTLERLRAAIARASHAVKEHNRWLAEEILPKASESYAVSPHVYARYFEVRGYGLTADQALEVGETYLKLVRKKMADLARQIVPSGSVKEALDRMRLDHPSSFEAALEAYRASAREARDFILEKDLMTVPDGEELLILGTPQFMRPMTPFAAQYEPGKFDGNRTGMFVVTPDDGNPEYLREHSLATIGNTTVHEGYPGHHLQGICSNSNPSYIRALVASPDFGEGWGLYSEDLMISLGYNDHPQGRLTNLTDLMFRIVRLIIEVRLAKGNMTPEEGARMLVEECVIDPNAAKIEARSCGMSPTYYSSYFVGKLALMQLREDVERAMGAKFTLKFFHDALLYAGCMPVSFMRRAVALKLKESYGIELRDQAESLYEYAMRKAKEEGA